MRATGPMTVSMAKTPVDQLRAIIKRRKLTQVAVAKMLGKDARTIRRWLQDPKSPGFRECPAWAPELLQVRLRGKE